jgi:hypothetical protein
MKLTFLVRLVATIFLTSHTCSIAQKMDEQPESIPIGLEGKVMVVLPGPKLKAAPVGDKSKIILRIHDIFPNGNSYRYDLRYFGFVPGKYNLNQFLLTLDGKTPTNLPPTKIIIGGILPEDHDGILIEEDNTKIELSSNYTAWLIGIVALWILIALPLFLAGLKSKKNFGKTNDFNEPDLAQRLRPLVEQAATGDLDTEGRAILERMIFSHWREQLNLPKEGNPVDLYLQLKQHDDAGPLLCGLEDWLHRPPGTSAVDITALLEPYRKPSQQE